MYWPIFRITNKGYVTYMSNVINIKHECVTRSFLKIYNIVNIHVLSKRKKRYTHLPDQYLQTVILISTHNLADTMQQFSLSDLRFPLFVAN